MQNPTSAPLHPESLSILDDWLRFQLQVTTQPGLGVAIARNGELLFERNYGLADLARDQALTQDHRFRVASHSKTFTAAGVLLLRDRGLLDLADPVGRIVSGLHPDVAARSLTALLTHTAGLTRDGADAGQWGARRPFKSGEEVVAELASGPVTTPDARFKYSNHGYALLGMVIETLTGEPYARWIARELLRPLELLCTQPDITESDPVATNWQLASGHSSVWPAGRRLTLDVAMSAGAMAPAGGFVSTPADLARFYSRLAPDAEHPLLSAETRQEMIKPRWPEPDASVGRWYGLGMLTGAPESPTAFGHAGVFPGVLSRTVNQSTLGMTLSMISNCADGLGPQWLDGAIALLSACQRDGPAPPAWQSWAGIWWGDWMAFLVVPTGSCIFVGQASLPNPMIDATELAPIDGEPHHACIVKAPGLASYGELARLITNERGEACELWLGGTRLLPEARAVEALVVRFGG